MGRYLNIYQAKVIDNIAVIVMIIPYFILLKLVI